MMLTRLHPLFILLSLTNVVVHASFLSATFSALPKLQELAKAQSDCQLNIRLDIGKKIKHGIDVTDQNAPRLVLDGLLLELLETAAPPTTVSLPGAQGPHPQTSSGARKIDITQNPSFIGMNGKEIVCFQKAAWEMVWRENGPSGTLLCGFDVPIKAVRNGATLPACRLYLSFPLFTQDLLDKQLDNKHQAEQMAQDYCDQKDAKLAEYAATRNFFKKAFLYRDAAAAAEKMELTGARYYQWIPEPSDVVPLKSGLLVGKKGTIWMKPKDMFATHHLLGQASIQDIIGSRDDDDDNDIETSAAASVINKNLHP